MTELYFSPQTGAITDDNGREITAEQARDLWNAVVEQGEFIPCNIAFARLVRNGFDVAETLKDYE